MNNTPRHPIRDSIVPHLEPENPAADNCAGGPAVERSSGIGLAQGLDDHFGDVGPGGQLSDGEYDVRHVLRS